MAAADSSIAVAILIPYSETFLEATTGYKPVATALWGQPIPNCTMFLTQDFKQIKVTVLRFSPWVEAASIHHKWMQTQLAAALKHLKIKNM